MTIKRVINGSEVEIELTANELRDAYSEQEHLWDIDICSTYFDELLAYEDWDDKVDDETRTNIIEDAAIEYRRNINKYGMTHEYAISYAFNDVIPNYIDNYKEDE